MNPSIYFDASSPRSQMTTEASYLSYLYSSAKYYKTLLSQDTNFLKAVEGFIICHLFVITNRHMNYVYWY